MQIKTEVYCTLQIEGTHSWPGCPFDEVGYLRKPHRHIFHIKAHKIVAHDDRDTEFIMLQHEIKNFFQQNYYRDHKSLCVFGAMSCEMIAMELIHHFELCKCEVSEDGENGAIVTIHDESQYKQIQEPE